MSHKSNHTINHYLQKKSTLIILLLLGLLVYFKTSALLALFTEPDPGLFASTAYHMLHKKSLYTQLLDHKPPLIFYTNLLILKYIGSHENAISYVNLIFTLLLFLLYYKIAHYYIPKFSAFFLSIVASIAYLQPAYYGSGNYTEFWGAFFILLGIFLYLYSCHFWLVALAFVLACFYKETFILPTAGFIIGLHLQTNKNATNKQIVLSFIGCFCAAFIILVASGLLLSYWHQFVFSLQYIEQTELSLLQKLYYNKDFYLQFFHLPVFLAWFIYLSSIVYLLIHRKSIVLVWPLLAMQAADYVSTAISGHYFGHYYLQSILITVLIIGLALSHFLINKIYLQAIAYLSIATYILIASNTLSFWKTNPEKPTSDAIVNYLDQKRLESKPIHIELGGFDVGIYLLRAKALSNHPYIVPYNYHRIGDSARNIGFLKKYYQETIAKPPPYFIYSGTYSSLLLQSGVSAFIDSNYSQVLFTDIQPGFTVHLLKHKGQLH